MTARRRRRRMFGSVTLRRGRWETRYTDLDRCRHYGPSFASRIEAEVWLAKRRALFDVEWLSRNTEDDR